MEVFSTFKTLITNGNVQKSEPLQFRIGQVFFGKINKLFPNQLAEINLGSQKMIAKLEIPLTQGQGYLLQVTGNDGEIKLKLLNKMSDGSTAFDLATAVKQMGLPHHKLNEKFIQFMIKEHLSFTKEEIILSSQLLKQSKDPELGMQILKMMNEQKLAINEPIFSSLLASHKDISTSQLLTRLQTSLQGENKLTEAGTALLRALQAFNIMSEEYAIREENGLNRQAILQPIKSAIQHLGVFYENTLLDDDKNPQLLKESIKPLLVNFTQEALTNKQTETRDIAQQLLFRMNGMQLLSTENGLMQQIIYEIPINIKEFATQLTMQWSGKRTSEGKMNPDFCRIIFYLELASLKETVIDMQVQNRIVTVNIFNEAMDLKGFATSLLPSLKQGLAEMNYHLSTVNFTQPKNMNDHKDKKYTNLLQHSYTGVDFRI